MKRIILFIICLLSIKVLNAQVNLKIGAGAYIVARGNAQFVMDTGNMANNGAYIDSTGLFVASGGITFSGSGVTHLNNFNVNNAQHTTVNSLVSVYNTANLVSGNLNANNNLYIRSDANNVANMVVSGVLTGNVKGIVVKASATSGACPSYTSNLSLNISGPVVNYQWQSSADSAAWTNVTGATQSVYTATVTATIFYRCNLGTNNSGYSEVTPGVKLLYGPLPNAGVITGPSSVTTGSNITLIDAVGGGVWSATNSNATVSGGIVTGVTAGSVTISYAVTNSCGTVAATKGITVNNSSLPGITGIASMCAGATTTLYDGSPGGTWSSSNGVIATVGSTGIVTGGSAGTATITYTQGGAYTTITVTVNVIPLPVQGSTSECVGITTLLSDGIAGGTWSSSNANAAIDGSGNITGITAGTSTTTYTLADGCFTTYPNTVHANPSAITGIGIVCVGAITILSDTTSGALSYTSSNTLVATVDNSGTVTGVATGTARITYKILPGCTTTTVVTVTATSGAISGNNPVCAGSSITLSDVTGAGTWTSSNTAIATIGSGTGTVTGIAGGTATITYMPGTGGCKSMATATVNAAPPISGNTPLCAGTTTTLSDASTGGTWFSSNTGVATIGLSSGILTGISTGSASITYTLVSGCARALTVNVTGAMNPVSGPAAVCAGSITTFSDLTSGGTWSLSSSLVAAIGSATGIITASGTYAGTTTISYTAGSCVATRVLTVNPNPLPIQGASSECAGVTITLSDATTGGVWSALNTNVSLTGTATTTVSLTGAIVGTSTITYTAATSCYITYPNTIYVNPGPITGTFVLCAGSSTNLTDATLGGVSWTSSNTAVVTNVGSTVTGVSAGTATITYKITTGSCIATHAVTINALPVVTTISGPASISHASPATLSDATSGGIWTSSNTSVISLSGSTGSPVMATAVVTSGNSVIGYKVTNSFGCAATVTKTISATAAPPPHGSSTTLLVGATVNLMDDMASGVWSSSDNTIATVDDNGIVTGITPGSVNIMHIMTGGQGNVTTVTPVVVTAIPASISLLPNPNKGTFTVKGTLGNVNDGEILLEVTNVLGQVIYRNKVIAQNGKINEMINLGNTLSNGMYILNVRSGTENKTFHFVIEQ